MSGGLLRSSVIIVMILSSACTNFMERSTPFEPSSRELTADGVQQEADRTRELPVRNNPAVDSHARTTVNPMHKVRVTGAAEGPDTRSPLLTDIPASAESVNLLNGRDLAELIEVNEPVRASLREWLTWMRPFLLDTWENYQYMRYKMWPAYATAGLPEALLFGILAKESGGKVHAVSSSGAAGPLQFMPATGQRYGLEVRDGFDLRYDPASATQANVAYLNDQFARLNNDLALVLGAYNGGEGRMGRLSPQGTRRFWDRRVFDQLPAETRTYVPMVLAAAWLFMHPEQYGLRFPKIDVRPGEIRLGADLSLNELSICLGQVGNDRGWFRTLRNLNPRWDPNTRLPAGTRVEVPASAAIKYAEQCNGAAVVTWLHAMQDASLPTPPPAARPVQVRTHTVLRGETLSKIARKHGCSVKLIAQANRIAAPRYSIRIGQRLQLSSCHT
jgi:membrane-bound lytic murein transglycosylase D